VILPVSGQGEFIYRVGSTKINHYFQNSVEYGNTVTSSFKRYKDYRLNKEITFYVVNDIHDNTGLLKKLLNRKDYDFIVLNGDIKNSDDSRQVIENKILKPVSECTDGTKPFYLVRGNHETRGASARDLPDYLSLPDGNFYYTFQAGPVYAIVLDSAEDKPDSHEEYSGLADFERYLGSETKWLQTLSQSKAYKSAKFKIAFVHIPLNDFDDKDDSFYLKTCQQKWRELLNGMEIDAAFSGHAHSSYVIKKNNTEFTFDSFIGGGDSLNEKEFIAIKAEVTENSMKVYYINTSGEIMKEYEVF
jgi:predicted phosphodiesterase